MFSVIVFLKIASSFLLIGNLVLTNLLQPTISVHFVYIKRVTCNPNQNNSKVDVQDVLLSSSDDAWHTARNKLGLSC